MVTFIDCLIVGIGGAIGAVCRYLVGLLPLLTGSAFPFKTFLINIAGCFLIGVIAALALKGTLNPRIVLFLKVGFCGGFTTFSSFALETSGLLEQGFSATAALYIISSVALGYLACLLAQRLFA